MARKRSRHSRRMRKPQFYVSGIYMMVVTIEIYYHLSSSVPLIFIFTFHIVLDDLFHMWSVCTCVCILFIYLYIIIEEKWSKFSRMCNNTTTLHGQNPMTSPCTVVVSTSSSIPFVVNGQSTLESFTPSREHNHINIRITLQLHAAHRAVADVRSAEARKSGSQVVERSMTVFRYVGIRLPRLS